MDINEIITFGRYSVIVEIDDVEKPICISNNLTPVLAIYEEQVLKLYDIDDKHIIIKLIDNETATTIKTYNNEDKLLV